jgi:endonuclease/exonuclease/phosphatase family metal-dependent hydrolase
MFYRRLKKAIKVTILIKVVCQTLSFLLFSVILASCSSFTNIRPVNQSEKAARPITVMSFNIRIGAGRTEFGRSPYKLKDDIVLDLKPIAEAIRSIDPDIVGLQEVLGMSQAAELGEALNMNYAYVPHGIDRYGTWWGVALLSKFPLQRVTRHEISGGRGNTRAVLIAEINVFGTKMTLMNIHKDRDLTDGGSLREIMGQIMQMTTPVILMGDLNIWPADDRHTILNERLLDSALLVDTKTAQFARERGTYPGEYGDCRGKRIDYILVDKAYFTVADAGIIDKKHWESSDHLGYYTKVILQPSE